MPELGEEPSGASAMLPIGTAEFDQHLVSREFIADPYATLQRMQREAPIYWSDSVGGWLVTRYDDIMPLLGTRASIPMRDAWGAPPPTSQRQTVKSYPCSNSITRLKGCCTLTRQTTRGSVGLRAKRSHRAGSRASGQYRKGHRVVAR